ncbi:MAG: hypothetical protein IJX13_07780 [Clostridia bacterium]|nr:hypothetical protein [Clostridia bacterium]
MKQNQTSESNNKERTPGSDGAVTEKEKGRASVSLPRSHGAPDFLKKESADKAAAPAIKKKVRRVRQIPVSQLPEDIELDEELDELLEDGADMEEIPIDAPEEVTAQGQRSNPLLSRIRERRERQAEENLSALELIRKKSGFSEDDIAMMLELGYESELGRVVGYDNLKRLKNDHKNKMHSHSHKQYQLTALGLCGEENANARTKARIIAAYARDRKYLILRTLLTALATILLLFLDLPLLIGSEFAAGLGAYPLLLPIVSACVFVLASALSYRQLIAGLKSAFALHPSPYSLPALLFPLCFCYDVTCLIAGGATIRINFIYAALLLLYAICDVLRLLCEMRVFRLVATDSVKTVLESTVPRKKKLRQGKKLVKIINDDIDESFYRVHHAEETEGFFRRFNTFSSVSRHIYVLLGVMLGSAFTVSFVYLIARADPMGALSAFATVLFASAPVVSAVAWFYPLCRANKLLSERNCALVGDEAVEEYSHSKTVIFNDSMLYNAEKCTHIAVRESEDMQKDMKLAGILFRKIGGALESVGRINATKAPDPSVAFVRIADRGVEAIVDNQYHMIAGHAEFLKKCGIRIPKETSDKALRRGENTGLMYVSIDGVLKLRYEIEYSVKPSFERIACDLSDIDTTVALQSYDPNLNEAFLQLNRSGGAAPIRIIKPGRYESDSVLKVSDTGAVALGDTTDIVYPLHAAKGAAASKHFAMRLQLFSTALGIAGGAILAFLSLPLHLVSLSVALYHGGCILVSVIATHINLNKRKLHMNKKRKR